MSISRYFMMFISFHLYCVALQCLGLDRVMTRLVKLPLHVTYITFCPEADSYLCQSTV